jgi:hypothetical protein
MIVITIQTMYSFVGATQLLAWSLLQSEQYEEAVMACNAALSQTLRLFGSDSVEVAGKISFQGGCARLCSSLCMSRRHA